MSAVTLRPHSSPPVFRSSKHMAFYLGRLIILLGLVNILSGCGTPCPAGTQLEGVLPDQFDEKNKKERPDHFEATCVIPGPYGPLRHGFYKKWYPKGEVLKAHYTYQGGLKHGPYELYYPDGSKKESGNYHFGLKHGRYLSWHRNTEIDVEGMYEDGKRHGDFVIYSDNGMNIKKGTYFAGVKHGRWASKYIPLQGEPITLSSFYHYGQISREP